MDMESTSEAHDDRKTMEDTNESGSEQYSLLHSKDGLESNSKSEDKVKAERFWSEQLTGEDLISIPQNPDCQISVVIPAYKEDMSTILRQLGSIKHQRGIKPEQFEVIYVVNNSPNPSTEVRNANKAILGLPFWKNQSEGFDDSGLSEEEKELVQELKGLNLFVVDKSSSGHEIEDCNVAKARNRGIAEATKRFNDNTEKNGIVLQTDADTNYTDPDFFNKIITKFQTDPQIIAMAGGIKVSFISDEQDQTKQEILKNKLQNLIDYRYWLSLQDILSERPWGLDDQIMSPANMITRSFETAVVGGVTSDDDTVLGDRLRKYANDHNLKYSYDGAKEDLQVETTIRETGGLTTSLEANIPLVDRDPFILENSSDGIETFPIKNLNQKYRSIAQQKNEKIRRNLEKLDKMVAAINIKFGNEK